MNYKYDDIKEYLSMDYQMSMRSIIICLLAMLIILGLPLIYVVNVSYAKKELFSIDMIVFLFITLMLILWGIIVIIKRLNLQFLLFSGILSVSVSLLHMRLFYIMIFNVIKVSSKVYFYIAMIIYVIIAVTWFYWLKHSFSTGYYSGRKKKRYVNYYIIASSAFFGAAGSRVIRTIGNETAKYIMVSICFLLIAYITILISHNLYKYYLIRKVSSES